MKDAVALVHVAADIDPLVARDAAERLEQPVAGELLRGDRAGVAAEPEIEPTPGRQQRPLVGRNGGEDSRAVHLAAIGLAKFLREILVEHAVSSALRPGSTPSCRGLRNVCSTWLSRVRRSPSQFSRKFNAALNTVGMLSSGPAPVLDFGRPASAPFVEMSWHGIAAQRVIMREARIVEQAIPERCLPRVLNRRRRNWSDRFLAEPPLRRRRLRDRRPQGAKTDDREKQARSPRVDPKAVAVSRRLEARGRHDQFTIQ